MIGSHNSMSYLPPKHWFWRLFTPFWRCQNKTIEEQIKAGVEFFDLRVVWDRKLCCWRFAHGLVTFKGSIYLVYDTVRYLEEQDLRYRIVLERGDGWTERQFRSTSGSSRPGSGCTDIIIKRGWKPIYSKDCGIRVYDHSFVPFHSDRPWWRQLSWRMFCTPRLWAKRHNTVRNSWKKSGNTVHFYDFATELKDK